jgi:hypothetical protein
MLRFNADRYISISGLLTRIEQIAKRQTGDLSEADKEKVVKDLQQIIIECVSMGCLELSLMLAEEICEALNKPKNVTSHLELSDAMGTLRNRIRDELKLLYIIVIDGKHVKLFLNLQPFGEDVATAFPASVKDVEEAAKCLAMERSTATVYHLMRVMEDGLKALAKMLSIPYAPSWESYIKQISDQIQQKHRRKGVKWKKDEPFFKEILGTIESVKISWRNPTMHIVRNYDLEEAEQVFAAVRLFMQRLAKKLKRN